MDAAVAGLSAPLGLSTRAVTGLLLLLTLAAYAGVWSSGWVYDDTNWLPFAQASDWGHAWRAPFLLPLWMGGGQPWAFHGFVLALHLVNGALVFALARRWLSASGAVVALGLFWLHPIQVEAVAYVSGGVDALVGTYALLAIGLGLSTRWPLRVGGMAALLLAASAKQSALPLLVVVPVGLSVALGTVADLAIAAALAGGGVLAMPWWLVYVIDRPLALGARVDAVMAWASALSHHVGTLVWPVGFSIEPAPVGGLACWALFGVLGVGWLAWTRRRTWSAPWWGWLWMVGLLAPRLLVVDAPPLLAHHLYLPGIAVWLGVGSAVDRFCSTNDECLTHG